MNTAANPSALDYVHAQRAPEPHARRRLAPFADAAFAAAARAAALLTLALLAGILGALLVGAWPAIEKYGLGFLTNKVWDPVAGEFGGLVMIYGTLATSFIALAIAVPVSFGIALFLTELSPAWLKRPLGTAIELLAAVPSIVYGMWGLLVFGPILATYVQQPLQAAFGKVPVLGGLVEGPPVGIGILSAGIILAIMIIPFIAAVIRDVFDVTPALLKESAYALGSTTWEVDVGASGEEQQGGQASGEMSRMHGGHNAKRPVGSVSRPTSIGSHHAHRVADTGTDRRDASGRTVRRVGPYRAH